MQMTKTLCIALAFALMAISAGNSANAATDATSAQGAHLVGMRRITQDQYRQIVADIFGKTIKLGGRFEPDQRDGGLLAVGASQVSVTASGFEQYDDMARAISAQVVDEQHRAVTVPCVPQSAQSQDD